MRCPWAGIAVFSKDGMPMIDVKPIREACMMLKTVAELLIALTLLPFAFMIVTGMTESDGLRMELAVPGAFLLIVLVMMIIVPWEDRLICNRLLKLVADSYGVHGLTLSMPVAPMPDGRDGEWLVAWHGGRGLLAIRGGMAELGMMGS